MRVEAMGRLPLVTGLSLVFQPAPFANRGIACLAVFALVVEVRLHVLHAPRGRIGTVQIRVGFAEWRRQNAHRADSATITATTPGLFRPEDTIHV